MGKVICNLEYDLGILSGIEGIEMDEAQEDQLLHIGDLYFEGPFLKLIIRVGEPGENALVNGLILIKELIEHDVAEFVNRAVFINDKGILQVTQVSDFDVEEELVSITWLLDVMRIHLRRVFIDRSLNGLQLGLRWVMNNLLMIQIVALLVYNGHSVFQTGSAPLRGYRLPNSLSLSVRMRCTAQGTFSG